MQNGPYPPPEQYPPPGGPPAYPHAPYGYPPPPFPYAPPVSVANSTIAIVSLVSGICGWVFLPFIGGLLAIIAGHLALSEIRRSNGRLGGDVLARIGLVLGYANVLVCAAVIAFLIWIFVVVATYHG